MAGQVPVHFSGGEGQDTAHYNGSEHLCSSACGFGVTGSADATQWGSSDHPETLPSIYAHRDIDVSIVSGAIGTSG